MKAKLLKKIRQRFKISDINYDVVMLDRKRQVIIDTKQYGMNLTKPQKIELLTWEAASIIVGYWALMDMYLARKKRRNKRLYKSLTHAS